MRCNCSSSMSVVVFRLLSLDLSNKETSKYIVVWVHSILNFSRV
jgi:hypothetical protein